MRAALHSTWRWNTTGGRGVTYWLCAAACVIGCLSGCRTADRTTRLQIGDLNKTVQQMAASLARSDFLADRSPSSPRAVIVINKVRNLTSDIIPEGEQWMLVARVRAALPMRGLEREKNIVFVITPDRARLLHDVGFDDVGDTRLAITPTHVMSATFRSATRTAVDVQVGFADGRTDFYFHEYAIDHIESRETVWTDRFEFKREATGLVID